MRRGGGIANGVEPEGGARDGLQLRALVQLQQAGHLTRLQEVEGVRPGGGGGAVTFYALQLLRPISAGHQVQLHVLRLLLVEQHLRTRRKALTPGGTGLCFSPAIAVVLFLFLARFYPDLCQLDKAEVWLYKIS